MTENNQLATSEDTHSGSRMSQISPVIALCVLALALAVNFARGKSNQIFEGVVVMDYSTYKFYPDEKDCHVKGSAYWLVPNDKFYDVAPRATTSDLAHIERVFHGVWKVKLRGNLSSIGRYGVQGKYRRELDLLYVINATQLDCEEQR